MNGSALRFRFALEIDRALPSSGTAQIGIVDPTDDRGVFRTPDVYPPQPPRRLFLVIPEARLCTLVTPSFTTRYLACDAIFRVENPFKTGLGSPAAYNPDPLSPFISIT